MMNDWGFGKKISQTTTFSTSFEDGRWADTLGGTKRARDDFPDC
jgi:hypothetical protein